MNIETTRLYKHVNDDVIHGLILQLTNIEVDMLQMGKESIQHFIKRYGTYTNDQIEFVYDLLDAIVQEAQK